MIWEYYNELYMGIPSGIRVDNCIIGKLWTTVRANGTVGVARTMGDPGEHPEETARQFAGEFLREAANVLKWDSLVRASVGVAAMNAFYNIPALAQRSATPPFWGEIGAGEVTVVGQLRNLEKELRNVCTPTILPLPEPGQVDGVYAEALKAKIVFLSGDSLINGVLPELLEKVGPESEVSLAGASVPAAPILFAYDNPIHNLSGLYAAIPGTVEAAALGDIPDLNPGMKPFSILPKKPRYLHENPVVTNYLSSPYRASAFNSGFNPWEGAKQDPNLWSPVFKG